MKLSQLFARRYLFSKKSHSVVNKIAGLSVVAVAMPVAAMILLLSVFNGLESLVVSMYSVFDAELVVKPRTGQLLETRRVDGGELPTIDSVMIQQLRGVDGVEAVGYLLEQKAVLSRDDRQLIMTIRGVDSSYVDVVPVEEYVSTGMWQVELGDLNRMVLGRSAAQSLGVKSLVDSRVDIYTLRSGGYIPFMPYSNFKHDRVTVSGIFELDLESEQLYALSSLRLAQSIFSQPNRASLVAIAISPEASVDRLKREITGIVGSDFEILTQAEQRGAIYQLMRYEKWGVFFVSLLVLVVASFAVVGALAMLITEKREEARTIRALGADRGFVRSIFVGEGALICLIAGVLGSVLGVGLALVQQYMGVIKIPSHHTVWQSYPVEFHLADLLSVWGAFAVIAFFVIRLTVCSMLRDRDL